MKILVAPDSFKNSMSAVRVCEIMRQAILDVCPEAEVEMLPIADGGEGTVEAMRLALAGKADTAVASTTPAQPPQVKEYHIEVNGSLANVKEKVSYLGYGDKAIIEMAQANGLERLNGHLDPLNASTYGTGEMIKDAIRRGYRDLLIGIGGSATNDGGTGALCTRPACERRMPCEPLFDRLGGIRHHPGEESLAGGAVRRAHRGMRGETADRHSHGALHRRRTGGSGQLRFGERFAVAGGCRARAAGGQ